ncbi:acyl-CoA dehydrogenase [Paraflavitalea soli]|uniref:Acyl-CoA dehydrogenase n=1 Tax=Paraflavitalea soli TaxID=2315862 RepID=A0A3B7MVI6_9BACT|nr:acyl-CoA dehydrogenase family protein [Paraflavitalea soli]AXY77947.1 acyl-CoA dehydrogenase [Paraflavitalea soli]
MAAHPSSVIAAELTNTIRSFAAAAEALRQLHPVQLDIIYEQGWFNLFVPKQYGGLELSLPEALHIEEALAWADGSTGWTVTLCSGANWFVGFLDPSAAWEVYNDPKVCLAGSGRASGIARINQDGYTITGQWNYATGSLHATAFTANCMIEKDGVVLQDTAGNPLVYSFWFHKEEVSIHKNWNSIGMVATASHGFEVKEVTVPSNRTFLLQPGKAVLEHPVYHFPFLAFAEATLAVNYSGMAVNFLDLCGELFAEKLSRPSTSRSALPPLRDMLQGAEQELHTARSLFYAAINAAWEAIVSTQSVADEQLRAISHTSRRLATIARQQVDQLYPFCGITAADPSTPINRVWRNLHTASQHSLLVFPQS